MSDLDGRTEQRISSLEKDFSEFKKDNRDAHKEFYSDLSDLKTKKATSDVKLQNITDSLDNITNTLEEIKNKPSKVIDKVFVSVISTIVGALIMYFSQMLVG